MASLDDFLPWKAFAENTIGKVLDAVLPDNMSEDDRAKAHLMAREMGLREARQSYDEKKLDYDDRKSARDLATADVKSDSVLARNVRPWFLIVIMLILANGQIIYPWNHAGMVLTLDPSFQSIIEVVIGFYFGGRSVEKVAKVVSGTSAVEGLVDTLKSVAKKIKK